MGDPNEDNLGALGAALAAQNPAPPDPKHTAYQDVADLYLWFLHSAVRILQYATITRGALKDFEDRGFEHLRPTQWSVDDPNSMGQVLVALNRKSEVDFLKQEGQNAEAHICGQAAVSLWGTLEVFVDDLLFSLVKHEPSRISKVPGNIKVALAEFYGYGEDKRIAEIVRLVTQALASTFKPGAGVFQSKLKAFGLGGEIETLTNDTVLEFAAVRNCIVHRKGIVDAKFKEACGTSSLNIGDEIRLTPVHVDRYFYAAAQYAATVVDRVQAQCAPDFTMDFRASEWLETLKGLQPTESLERD